MDLPKIQYGADDEEEEEEEGDEDDDNNLDVSENEESD